ncbi:transcription factor BIM2 isoform X2 [Beta vulgaris subsp. vulgaris]|uniref:transcription factor BIM2 isoform X2 n=1 Tax=Beta vulgaris subsp. vulgaris TaxID=3555 RepID=UPI002036B9CB|nr:transcription factor BIM2 isoform X2 [Beta vulgaris subsp. vulgaris]
MELPQSRPFGTAQARKATHDFLSLYTHSSLQQDPRSSHGAGGLLKTHNFLQPLEGEEKIGPKEDNLVDINVKPPPAAPPTSVVEHVLPGGIGTYSISHISYLNPRVPKPEENIFSAAPVTSNDRNDDNSNCSSYTGSGFTLWDESAVRKGNAGKENLGDVNIEKESTTKMGHWPLDRPSQSSSNYHSSVSPLSSSQALIQKSQSFMEMINSAKGPHSLEEEDEEELSLKRESSSSQKEELRVKVGGKSSDQKAITPRSKHSATEQRRRCKINDRFQMLRELIPHSDQKRDKASFLLEVIEYIQYLQEKVNRYEGSYPGWNSEPPKLNPWRNSHGATEGFVDQPRVASDINSPVLMFGAKLDEKSTAISLNGPHNPQNPSESSMLNAINVKTVDQRPEVTNKTGLISSQLQQDIKAPIVSSCAIIKPPIRLPAEGGHASLPQLQSWQSRTSASEQSVAADKLKDQELALEGGTINISSVYSQGLLSTLTRALQSSGVDLSQASISVQVDIGKRANTRQNSQEVVEKTCFALSRILKLSLVINLCYMLESTAPAVSLIML